MKVHLVTYGDDNYTEIKKSFIQQAEASAFFDEILDFSPLDIDPIFYKDIYEPLKTYRGGGYWIWKPYFVKKVLDSLPNGDIMFYCDAGSQINPNGKKRFIEYLDLLHRAKTGTIDFCLSWREYQFTKQEVFEYFRSSEDIVLSRQLMATVLPMRKCAHANMLVNIWYEMACKNSFLFTDEQRGPQRKEFIDHRHDQSVYSIIRKTYGANIIGDETYFHDFINHGQNSPIWSTQLKPESYK